MINDNLKTNDSVSIFLNRKKINHQVTPITIDDIKTIFLNNSNNQKSKKKDRK